MERARALRTLLAEKELLIVPGIYDALTAKIARYCGFRAIFMTGYGTAASYGCPDIGLLTMNEVLDNVKRISESVDIPLIADADTGYGNYLNVYRTMREFEKAGAAAIQIEDQTWPKRTGNMTGKAVVDAAEMVAKIKAAVDARVYPETIIIGRTDACSVHGFDEAVRRAHLLVEAGADVLFIESLSNVDQIKKVPKLFSKPCLINMGFISKERTVDEMKEAGYALAIFPALTLEGSIQGAFNMCKALREEKRVPELDTPFHIDELNRLLGLDAYKELEKKLT
jgi:2-methylisocitrate lyase-like PEP mutase family enzyme